MVSLRYPSDFYESLLPTFTYSTILGVFPMFPVKINGKYSLFTSKKLQLISTALLIIYSSCFAITVVTKSNNVVGQKFYKKHNKVSNFGLTLAFIFEIVILYTIYFASFKRTKQAIEVMVSLEKVDGMLKKLKQNFQYTRIVWYQLSLILSGLLMITLIASMQIYNIKIEKFRSLSLHMWILFLYPVVVSYDLNIQFTITAFLIYERFSMVNAQLDNIEKKLKKQTKGQFNTKIIDNIDSLRKIYQNLCDVSGITNLNYNIQMVPLLAEEFFISLYAIFYFYWMFSTKPFSATCWLAWGVLKSYEIFQIAVSCHLASEEADIVGRKVHKILIKVDDYKTEEKLLMFSQQVAHGKFKFTLCGLFNIDASLLFNMIGSSTTFIVIMIQFQETISPTINCPFINQTFARV